MGYGIIKIKLHAVFINLTHTHDHLPIFLSGLPSIIHASTLDVGLLLPNWRFPPFKISYVGQGSLFTIRGQVFYDPCYREEGRIQVG